MLILLNILIGNFIILYLILYLCTVLLNTIIIHRFNNLSIFMKDFQQEIEKIEAQNTISTEMETEVAREFKECKSDMVN